MKITTNVKAGGITINHNETQARTQRQGFPVKTSVKAGPLYNHNETQLRDRNRSLRVKTNVKAGPSACFPGSGC